MKKAIAVFDIDGTLLTGTSAERIFVQFLLTRGELYLTDGINYVRHFLATFPRSWIRATKGNRYYLRGKKSDNVEVLSKECYHTEIVPKISSRARRRIEEHKRNGLEIALLSGTPDFLLRHFQEDLGTDSAYGSMMEIVDRCYTGGTIEPFPYGRAKAEIVRATYGPDQYDLSSSYAYADHVSDFEFLRLFGHPHIVNPHPRLASKAKKVGIDTIYF